MKVYVRLPDGSIKIVVKRVLGDGWIHDAWKQNVENTLLHLGYVKAFSDHKTYYQRWRYEYVMIVAHEDRLYALASTDALMEQLISDLRRRYHGDIVVERRNAFSSLGIEIEQIDDDTVSVHQKRYLKELMKKYNPTRCREANPGCTDEAPEARDGDKFDSGKYLELVGAIHHVAQFTRSDLIHYVRVAMRTSHDPTRGDYRRALKMIHYLQATMDRDMRFNAEEMGRITLKCLVQVDRGTYGYGLSMGKIGEVHYDAFCGRIPYSSGDEMEDMVLAIRKVINEMIPTHDLLLQLGVIARSSLMIYVTHLVQLTGILEGTRVRRSHVSNSIRAINTMINQGHVQIVRLNDFEDYSMTADLFVRRLEDSYFKSLMHLVLGHGWIEDDAFIVDGEDTNGN
jgi:hypothetical protein